MRNIQDADLKKTIALPAAAAAANSASLDLGSDGDAVIEKIELEVAFPALANLADGTDATITIQDSSDDSSFGAVSGLGTLVVSGAGGNGSAASSRKVKLPSTVKRYVRINVAVESGGGDNTASSATMAILT